MTHNSEKIVFCIQNHYSEDRVLLFQKGRFYSVDYDGFHFDSILSETHESISFNKGPFIHIVLSFSELQKEDYFEDISILPLSKIIDLLP